MESKNMNYIFNIEYFNDLFEKMDEKQEKERVAAKNKSITSFKFRESISFDSIKEKVNGYCEFTLYTLYPGLLVGTGYPHEISAKGAIKQGFSFDYVTGIPYIPGSSLKGMIRSYFPVEKKDNELNSEYTDMIKGILDKDELDVMALKDNMFENNDVFLGVYPMIDENKGESLMEIEYITSHKEKFKNPNPISCVKIKPAVNMVFKFIFSDYIENDTVVVSAEEKLNLCKELMMLMGIGAKTNTGFGKFAEEKPAMHKCIEIRRNNANRDNKGPKCSKPNCNNVVKKNNNTGKYYKYCRECSQRNRNK